MLKLRLLYSVRFNNLYQWQLGCIGTATQLKVNSGTRLVAFSRDRQKRKTKNRSIAILWGYLVLAGIRLMSEDRKFQVSLGRWSSWRVFATFISTCLSGLWICSLITLFSKISLNNVNETFCELDCNNTIKEKQLL